MGIFLWDGFLWKVIKEPSDQLAKDGILSKWDLL